jgi:ubiquinone/menaquinone biosynthesis C-methylase UbiE
MLNYSSALADTITTYEQTAEQYFNTHSDIEEIKYCADYFLKHLPGKKVLDLGCGPGRDAKYFTEQGLEVVGIDLSKNFLQLAIKNAPKATFMLHDLRNLPFKEASFDGIWSCASLLHLPKSDVSSTLDNLYRFLKPKGILFVSLQIGIGEKVVEKTHYSQGKKFFAYYTQEEFNQLLQDSGFKILDSFFLPNIPKWLSFYAIKEK